jgi:hypothetical protein
MAVFFIPFLIGASYVLSVNKNKRRIGLIILVILFIAYNLSLFILSKNLYFDKEGKATKYYALTPEGVVYSDQPGVDRETGIEFRPVTPEIIRKLKLIGKGDFTTVNPNNVVWFNPITGDPQLWYYQHPDKSFDFFDKPGYHPIAGEPLLPVSKEIYRLWKETTIAIKDEGKIKEGEQTSGENNNVNGKTTSTETFNELDDFKTTFTKLNLNKSANYIALAIPVSEQKYSSLEKALLNQLKISKGIFINNYFKNNFYTSGYFDKIYSGDTNLLTDAGVFTQINYLILGQMTYSFRKSNTLNEELISCDINFGYKILNKNASVISSDNISVIGPGFTEELALGRGIEILAKKYSEILEGKL